MTVPAPRPDEGDTGEKRALVEFLAEALWDTSTSKSTTTWAQVQEGIGTKENYRRMASDLLAAIGLEQVGWLGPYGIIPGGMDNDVPMPGVPWRPIYTVAASGRSDDRD